MIWLTEIKKPDPLTGELLTFCGPRIEANSWEEAVQKIRKVKYCRVLGSLVAEIDYQHIDRIWTN